MSEVRKYFRNNISGKFEPACSDTFLYEGRIVTTDKEGIENTSSFKSLEQWSKYPYTTKKYGEVNFIFGTYFRANVQHFIYLSDGWCLCIDFNRRVLLTKKFVDSETEIQVPADEYGPFGDICTLESGRKAILWNGAYFFSDGSYLNKDKYGVPPVAITTWNFLDAYRLSNIEKFLTEKHSVLKSLEIEHTRASALNVTFDLQATLYSIEVEHRKNPFPQKIWDKIADFRKELNEVQGSLLKKSETHKEFIDKVRAVFQANMDFLVESNLQDSHSSLEPGEIVWFEDDLWVYANPQLLVNWKGDSRCIASTKNFKRFRPGLIGPTLTKRTLVMKNHGDPDIPTLDLGGFYVSLGTGYPVPQRYAESLKNYVPGCPFPRIKKEIKDPEAEELKEACSKYLECGGTVKYIRGSTLRIGDICCIRDEKSCRILIYLGTNYYINMNTNVITRGTNTDTISVLPAKAPLVTLKDSDGYVRHRVLWNSVVFHTEPGERNLTTVDLDEGHFLGTIVGFEGFVKPQMRFQIEISPLETPMKSISGDVDVNESFMDTDTAIYRKPPQDNVVEEKDPLDPPDLVKSWKDDLFDAGVRVAIRQGQKATVAHIAAVLCRNLGNSTEEFYNKTVEFLSSPVASAIILRLMSVGISAATSMTETPDPVRNALARELRIESLASPMEAICEVFTEPLRKEVCGFLEGVIPPPNKHQLSSPSTNQSLEFDQGRDMCELYHTPSLRILPLSCLR